MDIKTLEKLKALEKAATPAPWETDNTEERNQQACAVQIIGPGVRQILFESSNSTTACVDHDDDGRWFDVGSRPNFEFVAALRNQAVPIIEAAADCDRLRAEVERFIRSVMAEPELPIDWASLGTILSSIDEEIDTLRDAAANAQAGGEET